MKKQIVTTNSTHLIRAAFVLILPFLLGPALGQGNASKRSVAANLSQVAPPSTGAISAPSGVPAKPTSNIPAIGQSQLPTATSGAADAHAISVPPMPKFPQVVLYDQYNNAGANATLSATFTDFPTASSDLADDFVVPAGQTWNVQSIDADGVYFNGSGPATNWNVFIYANSGGLPGTQIFSATNQPVTVVGTTFTVTLPVPAVLNAGTYWIEIQANMTFGTQGEWGWTDRTVQSNQGAAWQNPGGYFGFCTTWGRRGDPAGCNIDPGVPDQVFRINGTLGAGCDVFQNGGFETGSFSPWVVDSSNPAPVVSNLQAHSGTFSGHVGSFPGGETPGDSSFYQTITVPAAGGTLSYWYWPRTVDSITFDWQDAYVQNTSGVTLATIMHVCQNTQAWTHVTFDMTPYAGQTVRIKFLAHGDNAGDPTDMFVDDVSLQCGGGGGCNGSKIYNIAGFGASGVTNTTRIYDIGSNSWTTGAPCPASLSDLATAYWNGKIYVAGGYNGSGATNTLYIYDIASNTWSNGPNMPTAVYLPGFGIINGKLYVASGNNGSTEQSALQVYDIASNTWSTDSGAPVPTPVTGPGSAVYQGKLYLFGGAVFPTTMTITQIFNPGTNSWTTGPNMNVARLWFYGGAIDDSSIVAPGGDNSPGIPINDNEQLTASWTVKAPLPFPSRGPFAVSDGTVVYIGGGYDGSTVHADLLRYDPVANTYTPLASSPDVHFLSQAVLVNCAPMAQDAFSRKVHGGAGTFDIPLPLSGNVGVECRSGGATNDYQMIIDFATAVTVESASVTSGTGMVSSFSGSGTSQITVNLTGVTNVQRITMTLHNVNNGTTTGDVPISMGVLIGDVNGNAVVNASDVSLTKSQVGNPVTSSNFREDVNVNGTISATDVALVKSKVGTALPP